MIKCSKCARVLQGERSFSRHRPTCRALKGARWLRNNWDGGSIQGFVRKHKLPVSPATLKTYLEAAQCDAVPDRITYKERAENGPNYEKRVSSGQCARCHHVMNKPKPGLLCSWCYGEGWRGRAETAVIINGVLVSTEWVRINKSVRARTV